MRTLQTTKGEEVSNGRIWRLVLLFAMAVIPGVAFTQAPSHARDSGPPDAVLKEGKNRLQEGRLGSYCWPSPSGYRCVDAVSPPFPESAPDVKAGRRLHVRIREPEKPDVLNLVTYRGADKKGFPVGKMRRIKTNLRPVAEGGRTVAWDAVFRVRHPGRQYYLDLFGVWGEGTASRRDASWAFHVEVEKARR